jgi:hypothetical protein
MTHPLDEIFRELERAHPSSLAARLDRDRPYTGQPHTFDGIRGSNQIEGLTYRDLLDCCVRGAYDASGLPPNQYPGDVYGLPWEDMDAMAVFQNIAVWVEKYQGTFPNVPT